MGLVYVSGIVSHGGREEEVEFLVDSGATYSLLKKEVWQRLGLSPRREAEFVLADGTRVKRKISECYFRFPFGEGHSPVILGEEGDDENLLGVVTLEILGVILDPFKRELRPARLLLK
ncbi:retroviral-like aspartic protease family protein [Thermosulfurimonas sp.]|uniref:aspartyl protease family protein n=1 Tax=Thermosulfurimonas sp. TaxID=2080236 RepID=UPI0025DA361E|nr:retroviral-like aspartic protease family protein [Thermosulfurimonas sp.]